MATWDSYLCVRALWRQLTADSRCIVIRSDRHSSFCPAHLSSLPSWRRGGFFLSSLTNWNITSSLKFDLSGILRGAFNETIFRLIVENHTIQAASFTGLFKLRGVITWSQQWHCPRNVVHGASFSVQVIRPRCKDSNKSHCERANHSKYGDRHDCATPTGFLGCPLQELLRLKFVPLACSCGPFSQMWEDGGSCFTGGHF